MKKAISYALIFLGIQALSGVAVTLIPTITGHSELTQSPYMLIGTSLLSSIVILIVFIKAKWATPSKDYLISKPWMAILWAIIAAIGAVIPSTAIQELLPELPNIVEEELGQVMNTHGGYFVVCLLVPLVEELVFRGAILRVLLDIMKHSSENFYNGKNGHWWMIAASTLFFAIAHLNPAQMPHAFVIGLLLGWMYYRTGSIVPGVAFHWANNTIAFFLFKLYPDPNTHLVDILGSQRHVAAAVVFSLFILLPAIYQLNIWMRRPEKIR